MQYDKNNVFHKIINGEVKGNVVHEGEHYIAIHDVAPKAPVHVLVIPKGNYVDYDDFVTNASDAEIIDFSKGIAKIVDLMNLRKGGFKIVSNSGAFGKQEVMHMHVHVLGDVNED
jgi:histidine triad (HIT) family protein